MARLPCLFAQSRRPVFVLTLDFRVREAIQIWRPLEIFAAELWSNQPRSHARLLERAVGSSHDCTKALWRGVEKTGDFLDLFPNRLKFGESGPDGEREGGGIKWGRGRT